MVFKSIADINQYTGTSVNPLDTPDTTYELYSVPSFDYGFPEIIKGSDIGSTKITVEEGDVLICKINPRINRVWVVKHHTNHQLIASSEWIVVRNKILNSDYLKWYFESPPFRKLLTSQVAGIGGSLTRAQPKQVAKYRVPIPEKGEQFRISAILNRLNNLISLRKQQLAKLEELVKARFVEMFENPASNPSHLPRMPMTELCAIIDGDRGKNYPKQDEFFDNGYCLFLNTKNVTKCGFCFETCMYISEEKDNLLGKGKLNRGDVVLTTRGTIGNLAYYSDSIPYDHIRINSGMVILRMRHELLTETFFIEQFKMQLDSIKDKIANGSAQPQLPISTMNKITMLVPNIESQCIFSAFVEEIDRQKLTIQQSLDKLEMLKKSLMQKYFG